MQNKKKVYIIDSKNGNNPLPLFVFTPFVMWVCSPYKAGRAFSHSMKLTRPYNLFDQQKSVNVDAMEWIPTLYLKGCMCFCWLCCVSTITTMRTRPGQPAAGWEAHEAELTHLSPPSRFQSLCNIQKHEEPICAA